MHKPSLVASITALLLLGCTATPMPAQEHHPDYDDVDPWVGFQSPEPAADSAERIAIPPGSGRQRPSRMSVGWKLDRQPLGPG